MVSKGIQNVEATVTALKTTITALGDKAKPEWQTSLNSIIETLENMKTLFFINSNIAISPTSACLKDATELSTLVVNGNLDKFPGALSRLQTDMNNLINCSNLDGVSLT